MIFVLFNILVIAGLYNILSLHLTVFIHFEEYWICFCAGEMSKYMFIFSLELQ